MTIPMDKVYLRMADCYHDEIEDALRSGEDFKKITFESFRLGLKYNGLVNSKATAKEKWENAILDGVLIPLGEKKILAMLNVRELLEKTGFYGEKKIKKNFSQTSQTVQEGA